MSANVSSVLLKSTTLSAVLMALSLSANAAPVVMDFETANTEYVKTTPYTENGFRASPTQAFFTVEDNTGDHHAGLSGTLYGQSMIFDFSGKNFDFLSIDIDGFSEYTSWELVSSKGSVQAINSTGTLMINGDGWRNINAVILQPSSTLLLGAAIHFDNITFDNSPTAVPLPTSAWFFGSSLVALAGAVRRKLTNK